MRRRKSVEKLLPLPIALAWIVGSILIVCSSFQFVIKKYPFFSDTKKDVVCHTITSMIQTGPQKEALRSEYLAELMGLCIDRPVKSSAFDVQKARLELMSSAVIQSASVKVIKPCTVYVDYTLRQPIAWLYDYENVGIDREGFPVPLHPFFPPKHLPEIYLGLGQSQNEPIQWNQSIAHKSLRMAFDIMQRLMANGTDAFRIKRIDVSKIDEQSLGKREVIVGIENMRSIEPGQDPVLSLHWLRLSVGGYAQEMGNYMHLKDRLLSADGQKFKASSSETPLVRVVDLRLGNLAFIEEDVQ